MEGGMEREGGREGGSGEGRDIVAIEHAVDTHTYTYVQ